MALFVVKLLTQYMTPSNWLIRFCCDGDEERRGRGGDPPGHRVNVYRIRAYVRYIAGWVPDHGKKSISQQSEWRIFWLSSAYKGQVYIIMLSVKCAIASLWLKHNGHPLMKTYFIAKKCYHLSFGVASFCKKERMQQL